MPREQAVPCVNASHAQFLCGVHTTFNDDRLCNRCRNNADRRSLRSTSPRVVPGAPLAAGLLASQRQGEGRMSAHASLPPFSRHQVHLSPYAAYLAALAVICGP